MGLPEVEPFRPRTQTVNADRLYFRGDECFVKVDADRCRSERESRVLRKLDHPGVPRVRRTFDYMGQAAIEMSLCRGETLENLLLGKDEKIEAVAQLLGLVAYLMSRGVVHGDINESNVLYDAETRTVSLVDFEMATEERSLRDLFGPPWGVLYVVRWLFGEAIA